MSTNGPDSAAEDTGLDVIDIASDPEFAQRRLHQHDALTQMAALQRLTRAFVESPDTLLQQLVEAAVDLCGADSAGISLQADDPTDEHFFDWVATAGEYRDFLHATLPRSPSACRLTLERGRPQIFRVRKRFFDLMGVTAPEVTDGLLLPWSFDETRGTIWVMAHTRSPAFDAEDVRLMQSLADFAALAVRNRRQQKVQLREASIRAAADMAHALAHEINNPLQSLTNLVYLAETQPPWQTPALAPELASNLQRLSLLVGKLLAVSTAAGGQFQSE